MLSLSFSQNQVQLITHVQSRNNDATFCRAADSQHRDSLLPYYHVELILEADPASIDIKYLDEISY